MLEERQDFLILFYFSFFFLIEGSVIQRDVVMLSHGSEDFSSSFSSAAPEISPLLILSVEVFAFPM